jgi:site-specific recombinase XerD
MLEINLNRFHGCHPSDLNGYFGENSFFVQAKKSEDSPQPISPRLRFLERHLKSIAESDLPAKDHFAENLRQRYRRNHKLCTLASATTSITQFLSFYRDAGKQHIEKLTREDIEAFTESLQDRGLKPYSVHCRLRMVYGFLRFLANNKIIGYELLERKIQIKRPDRLPRAMDPEDLRKLLSVIDSVRDRALILLLLRTGMRIGELLHTRVHDVDLNNSQTAKS